MTDNLKFKKITPNCPQCGNLFFFRKGSSQGYSCSIAECNFGSATTYIPEIDRDSTTYKIYVSSLGHNYKQAIVFLALKFNLTIKEARKFKSSTRLLYTGNARKVFKIRKSLQERDITITK